MPDDLTPTEDTSPDISLPPPEEPSAPSPASVRVFVSQSALADIRAHGYTDTSHECGGVMVGAKLEGERETVVLVEAVIAGAHTDNRRGSVTFTHETWEHINQEKDQKYSDLRIVGWYHTHPGFGIFLSDYDQFIQANFFNLPWNVAFVLDPLSGESGAFGWVEGKITRLPEYEAYTVADEHPPAPARPGIEPEAEGEPAFPAPPQGEALVVPEVPARRRGFRPVRWGVVVAAFLIVVGFIIAVAWIAGTYLLLRPPREGALPSTMNPPGAITAPAPETPPPAVTPPAPTPPPTEAPAPPPASNSLETAPAKEPLHEPGAPAPSGP